MEYIINILLWLFKPKDLIKFSNWLHNSEKGRKVLQFVVAGGFVLFISICFLISILMLLKHEFSVNGLYLSLALFITLFIFITLYFYFTFKDLFFPKNNNKHKPFSIV